MSGTKLRDIIKVVKAKEEVPIRTSIPDGEDDTTKKGVIYPGFEVKVAEEWQGQEIEGNSLWYRDNNGDFYWSGRFGDDEERSNDTQFAVEESLDWWQIKFGFNKVWEKYGVKGEQVKVAILDSGIKQEHPLLNCEVSGWNYLDDNDDINDLTGHGTQVASILAANSERMTGIIPNGQFIICKTVGEGSIEAAVFEKAIKELAQDDIDILLMSYSFYKSKLTDSFHHTINSLTDTLIVCSVGNLGIRHRTTNKYPASYDKTISVGAVTKESQVHPKSTMSDFIDVVAPGEDINTAVHNNLEEVFKGQGTSFSAPIVAGLLALMISFCKAEGKEVEKAKMREIICDTATLPEGGDPKLYGRGIINPLKAMETLKQYINHEETIYHSDSPIGS